MDGADDDKNRYETPAALSRRSLLRAVTGVTGMASLLIVGVDRAQAAKFSQKAVFYRPRPSLGQKCSNCLLFERPHSCRSVAGFISPNGWCVIWRDG